MKKKWLVVILPSSGSSTHAMGKYSTEAKAKQALRYYTKTTPGRKFLIVFY